MDRSRTTALALLAISLIILAVATLLVTAAWLRLLLAILALFAGYGAAFLLAGRIPRWRRSAAQPRRFFALRGTTEQFLQEVRRLNTVRVAVDTGSKSPREARPEFEDIERKMLKLIAQMREVAGQVTPPTGFPPDASTRRSPPNAAPMSR